MSDFIPKIESEFKDFAAQFVGAAAQYAGILGIPQGLVSSLQAELTAYNTAYAAAEVVNAGKLDREERRAKREALTLDMRKTKNAYIDADPLGAVTREIRLAFGLKPKDDSRTDVPDPTEEVPFQVKHAEYRQIMVIHGAKPEGYNGALALYKVVPPGGPAPLFADLNQSRLLTRTHEIMEFPDTQIGHTLYLTLLWENSRGRRGPAAKVQSLVIG